MDYARMDQLRSDIDWLLGEADLSKISGSQTVPITLNGITREVLLESLKYTVELLTHQVFTTANESDKARVIAMTIGGQEVVCNEPESVNGSLPYIARYNLRDSGNTVTMQALWDVGDGKLETRVHTNDNISTRERLKIFAILRNRKMRLFDNLGGLKDYTVDYDATSGECQINFS